MNHFGLIIKKSKFGLNLTRDNYIHPSRKSTLANKIYDDEYIENHTKCALFNFDLNMRFFAKLDAGEFNAYLDKFLTTYPQFIPINDLNKYLFSAGYYILVLDEYKQIYLGTTSHIGKRIREHWTLQKAFDRLIFGSVFTSRLSIDSFRPLDTTRIYIFETPDIYKNENNFISFFPDKFILNRTAGGLQPNGLSSAIENRKYRDLSKL